MDRVHGGSRGWLAALRDDRYPLRHHRGWPYMIGGWNLSREWGSVNEMRGWGLVSWRWPLYNLCWRGSMNDLCWGQGLDDMGDRSLNQLSWGGGMRLGWGWSLYHQVSQVWWTMLKCSNTLLITCTNLKFIKAYLLFVHLQIFELCTK